MKVQENNSPRPRGLSCWTQVCKNGHSRDVRSLCMPAVTMKLNMIPLEGICSGLSLSRGKTVLLVRLTPNAVSLETALTKENGPLPSSVVRRDNKKRGQDKVAISEQVINAEGLKG